MSQNSQDAIDVLSKVIVDTIEKKLNDIQNEKINAELKKD